MEIPLNCHLCQKEFTRNISYGAHRKQTRYFCSSQCHNKYQSLTTPNKNMQVVCKHCQKSIIKTNRQHTRSKTKLFFCSQKCSRLHMCDIAKYRENNGQKVCYICKNCQVKIGYKKNYCDVCRNDPNVNDGKRKKLNLTLNDLKSNTAYKSSKWSMVHKEARNILINNNIKKECLICHYN